MGVPGTANPMLLAGGAAAYKINQSLRFNSADSTYLYRTFGSGDRNNWTLSVWVKRAGDLAAADCDIFYGYDGSSSALGLVEFNSGPINHDQGGNSNGRAETSATLRDPSAWYHIVVSVDYGNATAANRVRIFVNGVQQTLGVNTVTTNDGQINGAWQHRIGARSSSTFNGYMAEMHFIGGTTVTNASDFGETDLTTGAWIPKRYTGSYGTNGFYLKFDPSATNGIGHDHSGNGNNFTPSGFSTSGTGTDVMSDTPTTNYATLNPILPSLLQVKDGNLICDSTNRTTNYTNTTLATMGVSSGKWYYEATVNSGSMIVGWAKAGVNLDYFLGVDSLGWSYSYSGQKWNNNSAQAYGATYTTGDVIGCALDLSAGTLEFFKNGTSQGVAFTGLSGEFFPGVGDGSSSDSVVASVNFGQRAFAYTPPTGYKALNTQNLPEPTIKDGGKYFNTVLYTGNASSTRAITGVGFSPDFVWIKTRSNNDNNNLYDAVRGATNFLMSNNTYSDQANAATLKSFDSDGFTVGDAALVNWNTWTYAAWCWDAGGSGSSNTAGSITSTVSANPSAGFSIVTYTGNSTAGATVGHGLGAAPSMIITKARGATSEWGVYHSALGGTKALLLNQNYDQQTNVLYWNNTNPSSTVFTLGGGSTTNNTTTYVAYCFSEVAGYSKFGSYTGNSSSDGPFVYLGFRPRFIWIKAITSVLSGYDSWRSWYMVDTERYPYNSSDENQLWANLSATEDKRGNGSDAGNLGIDILSNGFKIRRDSSYAVEINYTGATMIYCAWAEHPFKYSTAR